MKTVYRTPRLAQWFYIIGYLILGFGLFYYNAYWSDKWDEIKVPDSQTILRADLDKILKTDWELAWSRIHDRLDECQADYRAQRETIKRLERIEK